jgi:hypothetical protein
VNTGALRVSFGIISHPDFGGGCFLHDGCMAMHGTFCVCGCAGVKAARMMKKSGAALMRRKVEKKEEA